MNQPTVQDALVFLQIHIDAARNSTDDFNLFHDRNKWLRIQGNPFGGPIALGFQLECLIEDQLRLYRQQHNEAELISGHGLKFSNYHFTFASVVKPGEPIEVEIRKSQFKSDGIPQLSNRISIRNQDGIVLTGHKKETQSPLFLANEDLSHLPDLRRVPDRSYIEGSGFFCKRKFMSTGNAKNFLSGSLADQAAYFDELEEKVKFPETFPAALLSCALLERAFKNKHDFEKEPMVYTSHKISIDRELTATLKSNDVLHLLVNQPIEVMADRGLGGAGVTQYIHECFALLANGAVLLRGEIALAPLEAILNATRN